MQTESEIKRFILTDLNSTGQISLAADEDLLDSGIVDSVSLVQLVGFIEEKFSVVINPEELVPENFCCIGAITKFVEQKPKN
jgi:acyl carrier protein